MAKREFIAKATAKAIDKDNAAVVLQIVMLVLSVYVLAALFADTIFTLPAETSSLLTYADNLLCLVFIGDFMLNEERNPETLRRLESESKTSKERRSHADHIHVLRCFDPDVLL